MLYQKERATSLVQYDEENLYRHLLLGESVADPLSHMGWPAERYQTYALVLTISGDAGGQMDDQRIFFLARLSKYIVFSIHVIDRRRILVLVQPKEQFPPHQWRAVIVILCNMIKKQFVRVLRVSASRECRFPEALHTAYRRLIMPDESDHENEIRIEEDPKSILSANERTRLEDHVSELLLDGETDSAVVLLKNAWTRNRRISGFALWELISISVIAASSLSLWKMDNMIWESLLFTGCEPGKGLAKEWLAHVRAYYSELAARDSESSICRVMEILHAEFPEKLQLAAIARRVGLNPVYSSSQFCQVTGRRFADVITEIRIEHALRLLTEYPYMKNVQLAKASGFFSTTYFCEVFKKWIGKTVRQYVKENCAR